MKIGLFLFLYFICSANANKNNEEKSNRNSKTVNLAVRTKIKFENKDREPSIKLINDMEALFGKLKRALETTTEKAMFRVQDDIEIRDDLLDALKYLRTFENEDLEDAILLTIQGLKKCDDCHFLDIVGDANLRRAKINDIAINAPAEDIHAAFDKAIKYLRKHEFPQEEKDLIEYLDHLYKTQIKNKIVRFISEVGKKNSRRNFNLEKIIKDGIGTINSIYGDLNADSRRYLKVKVDAILQRIINSPLSADRNILREKLYQKHERGSEESSMINKHTENRVDGKEHGDLKSKDSKHSSVGTKKHKMRGDSSGIDDTESDGSKILWKPNTKADWFYDRIDDTSSDDGGKTSKHHRTRRPSKIQKTTASNIIVQDIGAVFKIGGDTVSQRKTFDNEKFRPSPGNKNASDSKLPLKKHKTPTELYRRSLNDSAVKIAPPDDFQNEDLVSDFTEELESQGLNINLHQEYNASAVKDNSFSNESSIARSVQDTSEQDSGAMGIESKEIIGQPTGNITDDQRNENNTLPVKSSKENLIATDEVDENMDDAEDTTVAKYLIS